MSERKPPADGDATQKLGRSERSDSPQVSDGPQAPTQKFAAAWRGAPDRIAGYRLQHVLGQGGMGEVWLAEQIEPVRRVVAIKLIKLGMDTREVVARFETERQALALMDHPNIAKVYDAGVSEQGRPYFAMEYVLGVPLSSYCDEQRLGTLERLDLLVQICDGVQHAHQKGIIHRDLKPSNLLVTVVDRRAVPKIIDFGIAKATSHGLTGSTVFTQIGHWMGTPEYMSPEQAEASALDVDTRSDVYSLGVVLYELLVGVRPVDTPRLRPGLDLGRTLRESTPARPSVRVTELGAARSDVARNRSTDPAGLARRLKGDLDVITLKALEVDRTRRYGSPAELAADIRRHLDNQPVLAAKPSALYVLGKLVRRHRAAVGAAAVVLLSLLAGLVISAVGLVQANRARRAEAAQRQEAERQAAIAEAVNGFLTDDLLAAARPENAAGREVTVREVLERAAEGIDERFPQQPVVEAGVRNSLGTTYFSLADYERARRHFARSRELLMHAVGPDHLRTVTATTSLGVVEEALGNYAEAEELFRSAVAAAQRGLGPEDPTTLIAMNNLATNLDDRGELAEAEALHRRVLETRERVLGEQHDDTIMTVFNLASVLGRAGRHAEALELQRRVLAHRRRQLGDDHPHTATALNNLAASLDNLGRYEEAEPIYRQALDISRRILDARHPDLLLALHNLATNLGRQQRFEEAERYARQASEGFESAMGPDHLYTIAATNNLAAVLGRLGQLAAAERLFDQVLRAARRSLPAESRFTAHFLTDFGRLLTTAGRYEEAEAALLEAHRSLAGQLGREHDWVRRAAAGLVGLYEAWGKEQEAEHWRALGDVRASGDAGASGDATPEGA